MRPIILFILSLILISCNQETKSNARSLKTSEDIQDTLVIKVRNVLNKSYEVGFYSKSYSYYWIVGKDTLDFSLNATEHEKDNTLYLNIHHSKPILFTDVLKNIKECFPLIKEDFNMSKLSSFYFNPPIYYLDLAKELSSEYRQEFGQRNVSYEKLNQFLLNSKLNIQLENFLNPLNKEVKRYSLEKFHIMEKKYYNVHLPNVDLTGYPEFTIAGMGVYVQLENK